MNRFVRRLSLAAMAMLVVLMAACGGKESVAERSATAFAEAQKKGVPVGTAGHEHGATTDHSTMDHSTMDHSKMDHSKPVDHSTMDHSKMDHSKPVDHSTMDHSTMDHSTMDHSKMDHSKPMDHSTMDHSKMDHSKPVDHSTMDHSKPVDHSTMDHSTMDHSKPMDHSTMDHSTMTGMQHGSSGPPAALDTAAPRSNAQMKQVAPAETLQGDPLDAPAPAAVSEAAKASGKRDH